MVESKVRTFRDLKVWQKAHELVLEIYKITKRFPSEERFGLISQIRRSASSIATNIVEGNKRKSRK
ncbi:four helix bundle protein, partial [Patescibacteria group bacterium]|nr:four helix bundle protein [Patescibacteria group bacterium]